MAIVCCLRFYVYLFRVLCIYCMLLIVHTNAGMLISVVIFRIIYIYVASVLYEILLSETICHHLIYRIHRRPMTPIAIE